MSKVHLTSYLVATRPVLALCLAVGVLIGLPPARAGENKWTSQGPFSGAVTALATDPQSTLPNITVFAGIDGSGVYRSDDGGESWTQENGGLTGTGLLVQDLELVVDIAVEPAFPTLEPTILYAATNGGGVFRATASTAGAPVAPLVWTAINGVGATALGNLFVLSIEVDPNEPNILYAGTNGGGLFRSLDTGATWAEINDGVGQRVVFDVEIPIPTQLDFVINEVHADPDSSGFGGGAETGEFIELKGQPLTTFFGVLVFYQAGAPFVDLVTGVCEPAEDFDVEDDAYEELVVGGTFDTNGLFVVADDAGVANVDQVTGFDLRDDTIAVALHSGGGFVGFNASTRDLLDLVIYSVGGPFDHCIQPAFGLQISGNNQIGASGAGASAARAPDGGDRRSPHLFATLAPTPGQLNVAIEHLLAGTDLNGVFRTDERRVTGRSPEWFPINNGLTSDIVFALAVDGSVPVGCGRLGQSTPYVGTSNDGVFKGTDLCDLVLLDDWVAFNGGLPSGTTIRAMEVSPPLGVVPSMIFAGSEEGKIFRRVTSAGGWEEVFNGLEGIMIDAVEVYQREGTQMVFAGSGHDIAGPAIGLGGGVFATVDSGANWFQTGPRVDALSGIYVEAVEIDPATPTTVYAGTFGGGVFVSTDAGATWAARNTGIPTSGLDAVSRFVLSLALDPSAPATLYAGTDLDGIFKTTDGGTTWAAANTGLPAGHFSIHDLEVDPTASNIVYAATGRLFKSTDGGGSWTLAITGFPTNTTVLDVEIDPVVPTVLYALTENKGLFKSADSGANWFDANTGLTDAFIRSLAVDPSNNTTVYAGTDGSGLFKSADGGLNWLPVSEGLDSLFVLSIAVDTMSSPVGTDSQTLYVGTENGGVFRSTDAANAWAAFNTGLTNFDVLDIEIDPTDSRIRYAGTFGGGVYDFKELERVTIFPSAGLVTTEAGGQATFTAVLTAAPIADVTLTLSSSNTSEGTVSPDTLLFTPGNGLLPQTVTITGVNDGVLDSDQAYVIITDPLQSFDTRFDGVDPIDVAVINQALLPQAPGIAVNPVAGLFTDETGVQATFTVVLTTDPTANVTIPLTSSDTGEGTVSTALLTFTPGNAQTPQTVTVTGVNDGVIDGDQVYSILLGAASSTDVVYNGLDPSDVSLTNLDNGPVSNSLPFETATLGATGQGSGSGSTVSSTVFIGAKFTLAGMSDITSLGGHFVGVGTIFVAIMPLDGGTDFPNTPFNPADALFSTTFNAPATSGEVFIATSFQLAAGRYAIVFGSGFFGATGTAVAPGNDTDIGSPEYFFSPATGGGSYTDGGFNNTRMFVNGSLNTPLIFTDGFESGDTTMWSSTTP